MNTEQSAPVGGQLQEVNTPSNKQIQQEPPKASCLGDCPSEQYIYALGRIEVRFPSLGIEREFQQREMQMPGSKTEKLSRQQRVSGVLEANQHLAYRVCYLLTMGGIPSYVIGAANWRVRQDLLQALANSERPDSWCVVIGKRGPVSTPAVCGGILAPILICDQVYWFGLDDWRTSLQSSVKAVLQKRKISAEVFEKTARELFQRVVSSVDNLGFTNAHRALNYLLTQHAGIFLTAAEHAGQYSLDRIETREIPSMGTRQVVAVILTFLDLTTGVPERLFCRVDVTEEWPFMADNPDGSRSPLALSPFVESGVLGMLF
jgi:hypothetical protein